MLLGERPVPLAEVIAATRARVVMEATRAAGQPPASVTYPWGALRRGVLMEAANRAGLATPVAAAAYFTAVVGHRVTTAARRHHLAPGDRQRADRAGTAGDRGRGGLSQADPMPVSGSAGDLPGYIWTTETKLVYKGNEQPPKHRHWCGSPTSCPVARASAEKRRNTPGRTSLRSTFPATPRPSRCHQSTRRTSIRPVCCGSGGATPRQHHVRGHGRRCEPGSTRHGGEGGAPSRAVVTVPARGSLAAQPQMSAPYDGRRGVMLR